MGFEDSPRFGRLAIEGYSTSIAFDFTPPVNLVACLGPKLILDVERGMPDFIGDGEFWTVAEVLLTVSGVKFTCLTALGPPPVPGVKGIAGSAFSRLGRLGLLVNEGIDDGFATGFFALKLG